MQHRYVPDLGDFSKFVVIDALSGRGELSTALVWYLVDPEHVGDTHKNDGKHTAYLDVDRRGFARCHPDLYARFQAIHRTGQKHVEVYERHAVLPNIRYFSESLSDGSQPDAGRASWRAGWLRRALACVGGADMVMLDPDNGLAGDLASVSSRSAEKYATLDECAGFYGKAERSLIVYQHGHRRGTIPQQADEALRRLTSRLGVRREDAFALRFHRGTSRCYLVVPAAGQGDALMQRARGIIDSPWGELGHFSLIR